MLNNTYQQLKQIKKITVSKKYSSLTIISNKYHLPRIKAFIKYRRELNTQNKYFVNILAAEDILIEHNPKRWKKIITSAYKTQAMKKRIRAELKGARDIKDGRYSLI